MHLCMYVCVFALETGKSRKTMKLHKDKGWGKKGCLRGRREGGRVGLEGEEGR